MLTRDHVVWAYRLLLDREPESEDVIGPKLAGSRTARELRHHLMTSAEFQEKNRDYAHTNERTIVIKELSSASGVVRLFVDLADHAIGLNIIRGRYEEDELAFARHVLRPGDIAIDAGAHIGFFSMQMAAAVGPNGKVYAFEPLDSNAELLERSIAENGFDGRVTFRRAAVGAVSGGATVTFSRETLNSGGAYLLRDGSEALTGHQKQHVPVTALDTIELRRPVRFIKMDVEGAEPLVLRGAARLLRSDRPVILSELHDVQLRRVSGITATQFLDLVRQMGYRAHSLDGGTIGPPIESASDDVVRSIVLIAE